MGIHNMCIRVDSNEHPHNIWFYGELQKITTKLSPNSLLIGSSVNSIELLLNFFDINLLNDSFAVAREVLLPLLQVQYQAM